MPLVSTSSWLKDLLPDAVKLLGIIDVQVRDKAQGDIQNIIDEFTETFRYAAGLPTISDARLE